VLNAIVGTVMFSVFLNALEGIPAITQDRFLACIYGGIVIGIGTGIILKFNSSSGGSDLISAIASKMNPNVRAASVIMGIDIVVITMNVVAFGEIEIGLYSAIVIFLVGKMVDILFEGVGFTKLMIIVSDKSEEISTAVLGEIRRGVTGLHGKGMYTSTDKLVLMCAAARRDVSRIKDIIRKIDPNSFIIITNSREVLGEGFKM